eukprot:GAHX01002941.1.p1 GENE.GAHX01002941.1~~GAHX01002941.1.p1  ORF type:complete len:177 (-),score=11.59 GAHX01002941.1:108-638(-)
MPFGGRPKHDIWAHYIVLTDGADKLAKCKYCHIVKKPRADRLKTHYETCTKKPIKSKSSVTFNPGEDQRNSDVATQGDDSPIWSYTNKDDNSTASYPIILEHQKLDKFIQKKEITPDAMDTKLTKFFISSNLAFISTENKYLKEIFTSLLPGIIYQLDKRCLIFSCQKYTKTALIK